MQATMCLLTLKLIILQKNPGKRDNKKELKQEKTEMREEDREEKKDNLVKIAATVKKDLAETEIKQNKEEDKEDAEETTDSDV
jgi:hypothetical protein